MISQISSSLESFKSFEFTKGLNIIVAERHETSSVKDTRNGTGKTSLIELIHYLLADRKQSGSDFYKPELREESFSISFRQSATEELRIEKWISEDREHVSVNGETTEKTSLRQRLSVLWFQLGSEISDEKYSPSFGALLSYYVRKERNGGFSSPTLNAAKQKGWDSQVSLSYLLGFDWRLPKRLQEKKDERSSADELYKMLKSGLLDKFGLDPQRMQARFDILENEISLQQEAVRNAEVIDDYRGHERTANELTRCIREFNEQNLADLDLIEDIEGSLEEVGSSERGDIETLYNEVGVFFPEQVYHRFEQVQLFHQAIAKNRKSHLLSEQKQAKRRLANRKSKISELQSELKGHLQILKSGIAIERYAALQSELTRLEQEQAELAVQIPRIRDVNEERSILRDEIKDLIDLIELDVLERSDARTQATRLFAEISRQLYDEPGELSISKSRGVAGLEIGTNIRGKKSGGKSHMQIFCFDLMLAIITKENGKFPGFLVHDSHIFDGVDGRQIGLALQVASEKCEQYGIQYIVAMNSDDLEKIRAEERASQEAIFDPAPYINSTRLSDNERGGLFGIRF
ncbi:DUF2326 domain-containing protein [Hyphomonas sp. UBA3195]|uniref:DUF2326 domain-containing protein n=1 Tax=Hyphomonas sp. UBA3195 TaxID=1946622 RepID=UPI0025BB3903|nr:DUF2326 domain-containing protein [Hyphomonas sp. UBA3195]|tara:strand:+ start:1330 stop:3060 length:1731 start_codon:yes stop_codon:yes gene_type:complete